VISRIHGKLGTAGFIISIVALVAALGGGAYAASGGLSGKQKKEVTKIAQTEAKKFAGKPGPAGAAGTAGPAGAKGDTGAPGAAGAAGVGTEGKQGIQGKEGSPWTAGGTLPSEQTETGSWAIGVTIPGTHLPQKTAISFTLPLVASLPGSDVHYVAAGAPAPAGCTGGTANAPSAEPGNLCVYEEVDRFLIFERIYDPTSGENEVAGAGPTGAILQFEGEEESSAWGTWAVTAEAE
jgi:hypothetical protein